MKKRVPRTPQASVDANQPHRPDAGETTGVPLDEQAERVREMRLRKGGPWRIDETDDESKVSGDLTLDQLEKRATADFTMVGLVEPIEEGWMYWMRVTLQKGRWVISQFHLFPWSPNCVERIAFQIRSGDWQDASTPLPPGGLTARHLRRVPFGARSGAAMMNRIHAGAVAIGRQYLKPLGRGPRKTAQIASRYVEALKRGSRTPNADVAQELKLNVSAVRDAIHRARTQGLLSPTADEQKQGVMGGELTPGALELLRQNAPDKAARRKITPRQSSPRRARSGARYGRPRR